MDRFVVQEMKFQQYNNILFDQAVPLTARGIFTHDLYVPIWFSYLTGTKIFGGFLLDFSNTNKEELIDLILYSPNKIIPIRPGFNLDRYIKYFSKDGSFDYAKLIGFIQYYTTLNMLDEVRLDGTINVYIGEQGDINA